MPQWLKSTTTCRVRTYKYGPTTNIVEPLFYVLPYDQNSGIPPPTMDAKSTDAPIGGQHEKIWTIVAPS